MTFQRTVATTAVQSSMCRLGKGRDRDQSLALRRRMARRVRVPHTPRSRGACVSLRVGPAMNCFGSMFVKVYCLSLDSIGFNFVLVI